MSILNIEQKTEKLFLIRNFLSESECKELIRESESVGYHDATINAFGAAELRPEVRNNKRVMLNDAELAERLYLRAKHHLPAQLPLFWELCGFNELWRFYRYDPGQRFNPHYDGSFKRNDFEVSRLSFIIYLNEGFKGGCTRFFHDPDLTIYPKLGTALVFEHRILHEGAEVLQGRKYALRTDVMYRKNWNLKTI